VLKLGGAAITAKQLAMCILKTKQRWTEISRLLAPIDWQYPSIHRMLWESLGGALLPLADIRTKSVIHDTHTWIYRDSLPSPPLLESELAGFGESISRFVHRLCLLVLYRNALEYYCVSTTTETRYSGRPETELVYLSAYGKSCFILIGTGYCFTVHKNVKSIVWSLKWRFE